MFARTWTCSRCLARGIRLSRKGHVRFQGSGMSVLNVHCTPNTRKTDDESQASATAREEAAAKDTIYPALLTRARSIAAEHQSLSKQLEQEYSVALAKKAGELSRIATALGQYDKANESLKELRALLQDPSTDAELRSLAAEDVDASVEQLHAASQSLTASLAPKHPFADLPCLIEIRPGAGGGEAGLFAYDLLQMYKGYCAQNGLRVNVLEEEMDEGMGSGLIEAVLSIESAGAYGRLRCEAGVHRVQRVPLTEKQGRTHTSAASVMVLPSFADGAVDDADMNDPNSDFYVDPTEVRTDVMRASGAGGQHVNRTESAVRLTHLPTNTVVSIQEGRSQIANKKTAWEILRSRIAQARREKREEEVLAMRRSVVGVAKIGRGDKVRTYNWAQQRITDHRSGVSVHGIDGFMAGGPNLEKLMESVRNWMVENEIEGLVADAEALEKATEKTK